MSHVCTVETCDRPTQDQICTTCLTELVTDLRQLATGGIERVRRHTNYDGATREIVDHRPGLYAELETTITRQTTFGDGSGVRVKASETPVPFHVAASEACWVLDNTISTWARDVAETYPHVTLSATHTVEAAEWLASLDGLLVEHPAADQLHDEVTSIVGRVREIIDRPADRVYLGTCGAENAGVLCPEDIYVSPHRSVAQCRTCGTSWDMNTRRTMLRQAAEDRLATAVEVSRAMPTLFGDKLPTGTIRSWAARGRLNRHAPHPRDAQHRPRFRIGDVLDLIEQEQYAS